MSKTGIYCIKHHKEWQEERPTVFPSPHFSWQKLSSKWKLSLYDRYKTIMTSVTNISKFFLFWARQWRYSTTSPFLMSYFFKLVWRMFRKSVLGNLTCKKVQYRRKTLYLLRKSLPQLPSIRVGGKNLLFIPPLPYLWSTVVHNAHAGHLISFVI